MNRIERRAGNKNKQAERLIDNLWNKRTGPISITSICRVEEVIGLHLCNILTCTDLLPTTLHFYRLVVQTAANFVMDLLQWVSDWIGFNVPPDTV